MGLHCSKRLSGRHEAILWFTKGDDYTFNLDFDPSPSKYPGKKYFKGPKVGQLSGNPLGTNPGDVWAFPNVKNNHVEKQSIPASFRLNWSSASFCRLPMKAIKCLTLIWTWDPRLSVL